MSFFCKIPIYVLWTFSSSFPVKSSHFWKQANVILVRILLTSKVVHSFYRPNRKWFCSNWASFLILPTGCSSSQAGAEMLSSLVCDVMSMGQRATQVEPLSPHTLRSQWGSSCLQGLLGSIASVCTNTFQLCTPNSALKWHSVVLSPVPSCVKPSKTIRFQMQCESESTKSIQTIGRELELWSVDSLHSSTTG